MNFNPLFCKGDGHCGGIAMRSASNRVQFVCGKPDCLSFAYLHPVRNALMHHCLLYMNRPFVTSLLILILAGSLAAAETAVQKGEMAGYLLVPNKKVPETFNAGFSMYVAA